MNGIKHEILSNGVYIQNPFYLVGYLRVKS